MELVYGELRKLAGGLLPRRARRSHAAADRRWCTRPTCVSKASRDMPLEIRRHFYGAAAQAMRRILVDYARLGKASKRGGPERQPCIARR